MTTPSVAETPSPAAAKATTPTLLSRQDLEQAHERIRGHAHHTPVLTSTYFDKCTGASLFFKCENFQKVGAFKFRGAMNTLASLAPEERARGVVTHSSGNHAQAVSLAARLHGVDAHVVMPENSSKVKINAVREYGARVILCEPTSEARESTAAQVGSETGATMVHPFDDRRIIAGQATAAMELLQEVESLDMLLAPVGGGGLLSGTALAAHHFAPQTRVIATEPSGADDAYRSRQVGKLLPVGVPDTIADGLRTGLSDLTYSVISTLVEDIFTVDDDAIVQAMRLVWERMKILIEPSAAVPVAAVLENKLGDIEGLRIGIILTGGNLDLQRLPW